MAQGGNDANGRFIAGFESVKGIVGGADERIDHFIILQNAHHSAKAYRAYEVFFRVFCSKEVDSAPILQLCRQSHVGMLSASGDPFHRLGHKGHL